MAATATNRRVYVADSPIHGRGLFAASHLPTGARIGVYRGEEVQDDGPHVLWIENEPGQGWTGIDGHNEMRFLNHAARPNAEMVGLECYALRDIASDEEITIDYGWEDEVRDDTQAAPG